MYKTNKEIFKEFDEKTSLRAESSFLDYGDDDCPPEINWDRVKSHISQIRQNDLKGLVEWAEERQRRYLDHYGHHIASIVLDDFINYLKSLSLNQ